MVWVLVCWRGRSEIYLLCGSGLGFGDYKMPAKVIAADCTGCELCVDECPEEAITMVDEIAVVNADKCNDCGDCVDVCASDAIVVK